MIDVFDFYDNRMSQKADAERAAKAAPPMRLAAGALNADESAILTALRTKPATSMSDLERRAGCGKTNREQVGGLNSTAFGIAYRALRDRDLVRETGSILGTTRIVAVD